MAQPLTIGVLALQGDFAKHLEMLHRLGVEGKAVRLPKELDACDGLILPGGESTVIYRNMQAVGLDNALRVFASTHPLFGTCAGLILMARTLVADPIQSFGFLDIAVKRNAYGRQIESFSADIELQLHKGRAQPFHGVFIRAPRIEKIGADVQVLARYEEEPILVQQGHHLGSTFHPELTAQSTIHEYFLQLVKRCKA